jgi:hypothetical protein
LLEATSQVVAAELAGSRRSLERLLREGFAPELGALSRPAAARRALALEVLTSWETWEQLRSRLGLKRPSAESVINESIILLMGGSL